MRPEDRGRAHDRPVLRRRRATAAPTPRAGNDFTDLAKIIGTSGLMRRRYGYYWTKLAAAPLVLGAVVAAFIVIGNSWWQLFTAAALA